VTNILRHHIIYTAIFCNKWPIYQNHLFTICIVQTGVYNNFLLLSCILTQYNIVYSATTPYPSMFSQGIFYSNRVTAVTFVPLVLAFHPISLDQNLQMIPQRINSFLLTICHVMKIRPTVARYVFEHESTHKCAFGWAYLGLYSLPQFH